MPVCVMEAFRKHNVLEIEYIYTSINIYDHLLLASFLSFSTMVQSVTANSQIFTEYFHIWKIWDYLCIKTVISLIFVEIKEYNLFQSYVTYAPIIFTYKWILNGKTKLIEFINSFFFEAR